VIKQDNIKIRRFRKTDLVIIRNLICKTIDACYRGVYCAEAVRFFKDWHCDNRILEDAKQGYTIVLEKGSQIIGAGTIVDNHIMRVFVDPVFQKHGFGKLIMNKLEEKAISLGIKDVKLDASIPSKNFYDLLDYVTVEETFLRVENNKRLDYYKMEKALIR
jgi:GNAT superfamily N-acetyltransferase